MKQEKGIGKGKDFFSACLLTPERLPATGGPARRAGSDGRRALTFT